MSLDVKRDKRVSEGNVYESTMKLMPWIHHSQGGSLLAWVTPQKYSLRGWVMITGSNWLRSMLRR